jgi:phasin family protein
MTPFTAEQLLAAHKANVETLFGLTNKAFEGVEKLVELNLQVAKSTLSEAADTTKAILSVKDAQELLALQASLLQPSAEKAAAYSRHLYDIAAGTNAEVTKVAEAQMADAQKKVLAVVDNAVKNAPAGTENAVALVKSAVAAANNAFDSVQKAAKQAAEVAEANFQAVTNTAVKATQTASRARKAA